MAWLLNIFLIPLTFCESGSLSFHTYTRMSSGQCVPHETSFCFCQDPTSMSRRYTNGSSFLQARYAVEMSYLTSRTDSIKMLCACQAVERSSLEAHAVPPTLLRDTASARQALSAKMAKAMKGILAMPRGSVSELGHHPPLLLQPRCPTPSPEQST